MTIDVLMITDGRQACFAETLRSAQANLHGYIDRWWVYCDTDDGDYIAYLDEFVRSDDGVDEVFWHPRGRQGFGGAIRYAWGKILADSAATHLFHLEDDFTFNRPVNLDHLAVVLDTYPEIVQMALRRQPWNDAELAAGGVVELHPTAFTDTAAELMLPDGGIEHFDWLEHRLFWTTNPALIRTEFIAENPWPDSRHSEGIFTRRVLDRNPDARFGYWGARDSGEWVHHIGADRIGTGY